MSKQIKFINRKSELQFLKTAFESTRAEFIVIYGRRRIGKTELIKESIKNKNAVYFFAEEAIEQENINTFKKLISSKINNPILEKADLSWEEIFDQIPKDDNIIIVFDEFPNLIAKNKSLLSKFQNIWDSSLKNTKIKLVFCGSSISMMESYLLDSKSPLYGRRTGQIYLKPLKATHITQFINTSMESAIKIYGITDGIPEYIKEATYRMQNGEKLYEIFQKNKSLFEEAEILLKSELRDPTRYFMILKAIAYGNTRFGEIVSFTNFPAPTISKYLSNLVTIHIIEEHYPVLTTKEKQRNKKYKISDNYFNFYFRFIYPNKSNLILTGKISNFDVDYNCYLGRIFEKVSTEFVIEKRPIKYNKIGSWWHKQHEIDIVALNDETKDILFVECKWKTLKNTEAENIITDLKQKAKHVDWNNNNRKEHFAIIAKKINNKQQLKQNGIFAYDLDDF